MEKIPLTKAIASSNLNYSRRESENLIRLNKVLLNGKIAKLGDKVNCLDNIVVSEKKVFFNTKKFVYIALNKPSAYVCTNRKFKNEKNIFQLIKNNKKLIIVGRLDKASRGLVLLSSDGDLAYKLTHPKFQHEKKYIVKTSAHQTPFFEIKDNFLSGLQLEKGKLATVKEIEEIAKYTYKITLTQGLNRQIRKMFLFLNIQVTDIQRIAIASLNLKNIAEGKSRDLNKIEIDKLKKL